MTTPTLTQEQREAVLAQLQTAVRAQLALWDALTAIETLTGRTLVGVSDSIEMLACASAAAPSIFSLDTPDTLDLFFDPVTDGGLTV